MDKFITDFNRWLSYSIDPEKLKTDPRDSMWGNGHIELLAGLMRPCITEVVCFGYGNKGMLFGRENGEEHQITAIYDKLKGKKYYLSSLPESGVKKSKVVFRPDSQIWRYEYEDILITVTLILPRLMPGYLLKVEIKQLAGLYDANPYKYPSNPCYQSITKSLKMYN
jgi:hypothetical protein